MSNTIEEKKPAAEQISLEGFDLAGLLDAAATRTHVRS